MTLGIEREQLAEPLRELVRRGAPVLGTCAGLIMLDRDHLGLLDVTAERNAFGRQLRSFEADLDVDGVEGEPIRAVFIRAPWVAEHGPDVEVLARVDGHPVAVRQGNILAVAFHPELAGERRLHELLLGMNGDGLELTAPTRPATTGTDRVRRADYDWSAVWRSRSRARSA